MKLRKTVMKKKCYYLVLIIVSFCSCQQDEIIYSCDPQINDFIRSNISEIQEMSRMDFLRVDRDLQPAIFSAFTVDQKQSIWLQKFQEVLSLNWSNKERLHIEKLVRFVSEKHCFENPEFYEDSISIFSYKWVKYARMELKWTDQTIYNMVYDPGTVIKNEKNELVLLERNIIGRKSMGVVDRIKSRDENTPPPTVKCTCNVSANDCGSTGIMTCKKWNCSAIRGCGFIGLEVCDGGCYRNDL